MTKNSFEDELMTEMYKNLSNNDSTKESLQVAQQHLQKAASIFAQYKFTHTASQVSHLLNKLQNKQSQTTALSLEQLMKSGITQRDLREFAKNNLQAVAKVNLTLHNMNIDDSEMVDILGYDKFMTQDQAHQALNPNSSFSYLSAHNKIDRHTKNLTPEKQIKNLKDHGTVFNMADDALLADSDQEENPDHILFDDFEEEKN